VIVARRVLALAALLALLIPASAAFSAGSLIGKWKMGNEDAGMTIEFSSGGVVILGDQVGTYWTSGRSVTIDGWNGKTVTLTWKVEGSKLTLTDDKGNDLEFKRAAW
jgi:hypothetical protein